MEAKPPGSQESAHTGASMPAQAKNHNRSRKTGLSVTEMSYLHGRLPSEFAQRKGFAPKALLLNNNQLSGCVPAALKGAYGGDLPFCE